MVHFLLFEVPRRSCAYRRSALISICSMTSKALPPLNGSLKRFEICFVDVTAVLLTVAGCSDQRKQSLVSTKVCGIYSEWHSEEQDMVTQLWEMATAEKRHALSSTCRFLGTASRVQFLVNKILGCLLTTVSEIRKLIIRISLISSLRQKKV